MLGLPFLGLKNIVKDLSIVIELALQKTQFYNIFLHSIMTTLNTYAKNYKYKEVIS